MKEGFGIMAQTNLTIRIDEELKRDAESLFNKIGLNLSSAINVFFRQAVGAQAIPFELKAYDDYYTGENLVRLKRSIAQSERGLTINFSMDELEAIENGEIPQRALIFLAKHKESVNNG
jgi:DNA-damage-inducible protein J